MDKLLVVGLGGAIGAICRYGISTIPWRGSFPVLTLITNLLGALLIGIITGLAESRGELHTNVMLFLKTGVCGGFTTFSTFSLEAYTLMDRGQTTAAMVYIAGSVAGCILGVWAGRKVSYNFL